MLGIVNVNKIEMIMYRIIFFDNSNKNYSCKLFINFNKRLVLIFEILNGSITGGQRINTITILGVGIKLNNILRPNSKY